jgi:hypothetical protein
MSHRLLVDLPMVKVSPKIQLFFQRNQFLEEVNPTKVEDDI